MILAGLKQAVCRVHRGQEVRMRSRCLQNLFAVIAIGTRT